MNKELASLQHWLRLRKSSIVAHWLYGVLCAVVAWQFFPAGLILLYILERFEKWNDQNEKVRQMNYLPQGDLDWWDAFIVKIPSFVIILILHIIGILTIRWY